MMNGRSNKVFTEDSEYKLIYKIVVRQSSIIESQISKLRRLQLEIDILEEILQNRLIEVEGITS